MITQLGGTFSMEEVLQFLVLTLVKGRERLRILFSTYNEVDDYDDGLVETGHPGLEILVATGGVKPSFLDAEAWRVRARNGQSLANKKLATQGEYPDIAVIYAGLSAFSSAIETVRALHGQSPQTIIVVLTCDCDLPAKEWELERVEGIGAVIVTPRCGGRGDMRDILEAFVAQWPNRKQEAAA